VRLGLPSSAGRRFARLATDVVTRRPELWRVFRTPMRLMFDRLASQWDESRVVRNLPHLEALLGELDLAPRRALDVGTGTGMAAVAVARRFPDVEVVGVDLSPGMVRQARRNTPPEVAARVRFEEADASALRFRDGEFDLVVLANMVPFYDELARVAARGGTVLVTSSLGPSTPIYVPPERLRAELARRGFTGFRELAHGPMTAVLARRPEEE
jgi:ubiquinone/menaquinone biosynthesis C-methylase UbiE